MRDSVFGFTGAPFGSAPDAHCWAPLAGQQQAFESLAQCLDSGRGIAILTAPAGIGKSLLCQRIAEHLRKTYRVAYLAAGRFDGIPALLQAVLFELDWPYQGLGTQELRLQMTAALREFRWDDAGTVLILDEAHTCGADILEEIRAATNLCMDGRPLLRVLLCGQYSLEEMLTSPELDALNQRIGCHVSLEPLSRSESAEYIAYRMRRAGADPESVITPQALQTICYASAGNPRCLNRLCDRAFELAGAAGRKPLDDATVRLALDELKRLPLHWNDPPPADPQPHDTLVEEAPEPEPRVSPPSASKAKPDDVPAGDTAVFEFGSDDAPTTGNGTVAAAPTLQATPMVPPVGRNPVGTRDVGSSDDPAIDDVRRATPGETGQESAEMPVSAEASREETEWTPVDPMPPVRREAPAAAPHVSFATQTSLVSLRIQPAGSVRQKPQGSNFEPMKEEIVDDHYAALIAAQRQQPSRVSPPPSAPQPRETEPASPVEAIDTLLAAVEEAVDDAETIGADVPGPRRERIERESLRFHSIEDYLQSARQDAVRMDRHEPGPPPAARLSIGEERPAGPRDSDLYARLRRLQGADE
jgi:type II secretory pathway predicted ATPase ExeA